MVVVLVVVVVVAVAVCGDASPNTGVPQHMGMHPHMLGHPSIWEFIPIHDTAVPLYMGMHLHIVGYPSNWGCITICWGTPEYGNAFP
jgi:hypothetical protein